MAPIHHGKVPDSYEKLSKLGEGAFGIVHKVRDIKDGNFYAMKEMKLTNRDQLDSANNEVQKLAELQHPRIVAYLGSIYNRERGHFLIFMEFMEGGSLRSCLDKKGPLDEKTVIKYIGQTLEGLGYVHSRVISHSDLKCDNLLLDGSGNNVKLGDFGIAIKKLLADGQQNSVFFTSPCGGGTYFWMAPEVMQGKGVGRRSDLWSLGCTIVEMLSGQPPYYSKYGNNLQAFISALGRQSLSYNPDELIGSASTEMKQFLRLLLQYDQGKRPNDANEAADKFSQLKYGIHPAGRPSAPPQGPVPPANRPPVRSAPGILAPGQLPVHALHHRDPLPQPAAHPRALPQGPFPLAGRPLAQPQGPLPPAGHPLALPQGPFRPAGRPLAQSQGPFPPVGRPVALPQRPFRPAGRPLAQPQGPFPPAAHPRALPQGSFPHPAARSPYHRGPPPPAARPFRHLPPALPQFAGRTPAQRPSQPRFPF